MSKIRIFKYSCLTLGLICGLFVCASAVFAATQASITCSTTVKYEPAIKAKVEVKVGSNSYVTIFDNYSANPTINTSYFTVTSSNTTTIYSSDEIKFKVTNYTTKQPISALVRLPNALDVGITMPENVSLCYNDNSSVTDDSVTISTSIAKYENSTASSAESQIFHIQTLFPKSVPLIVELTLVEPT